MYRVKQVTIPIIKVYKNPSAHSILYQIELRETIFGVLVKTGAETTCNALILTIIYAFKSFEPIFDASVCSLLVKTGAKNCTRFWLIHINFITLQCGLKRSEALLGSNFVRNKAVQYA